MSSHAGKTTFFIKSTSNITPKILPKSVQNTSKMVPKSWFGGVLGPCGGVLEPSGPESPPGCILGCENHVRGSPLGDAFWYNSGVFLCFFCCLFVLAPRTVFYGFLCDFGLIFDSISWVFWRNVEIVFFATLLSKTMIFQVPGLLFFSVFSNLFHSPFRTSFFQFF